MQTQGLNLNQNNNSTQATSTNDADRPAAPTPDGKALPKSALYSMTYKDVDTAKLGQHVGSYVRLTRIDRKRFEGKVLGADDKGIVVERRVNGGILEQKINFNDITTAEVMSKQ